MKQLLTNRAKRKEVLNAARMRIIKKKLADQLAQTFGYHALLYTPLAKQLCQGKLVIKQQLVIDQRPENADLCCQFEELPVAADSIDLAVLPAVLQTSANPHQVLREVERVLIPEGVVILVGRNPFGWLGIRHRLKQWRPGSRVTEHDISRSRISDWFRLLGFETEQQINISVTNEKLASSQAYPWLKKLGQTFCDCLCSYYIIIARKKVSTLTPIRPSWRRNKQLVPSRLAEPSVRSQVEHWFKQLK